MMKLLLIANIVILSFPALPQDETFTDPRDGEIYKTAKIGGVIWMAENLNYQTDQSIVPSDQQKKKYDISGRYYDQSELEAVCPPGWRIPTVQDWLTYFQHIAELESPPIELSIMEFEKPVHYTVANYAEKINVFSNDNPLNLHPTGRIEGGNLNTPSNYADYWTTDENEEIRGKSHIHIMNPWSTIHSHKHHLKPNQRKKLRKFMIRCVKDLN